MNARDDNGQPATLATAARMRRNLLPRVHAPLRAFMVAVMVMVFLAELAAAAVMMTRLAVAEWTAGVVSEATAQVLPGAEETDEKLQQRAEEAAEVLRARPGVAAVRILSRDESRRLIEPWLGEAGLSANLPVPLLIAIRLEREKPAGVEELRAALRENGVRGVLVDAHGRWVRALSDLASTALWVGIGVVVIMALALVLLVVHAARAALEANRETLEVLHLMGARDRFVARQVERHFLRTGLAAALAGALAAWLALVLLALLAPATGLGGTVFSLLFSAGRETLVFHAVAAFIIVVAVLISLTTARISAMRILNEMFEGA